VFDSDIGLWAPVFSSYAPAPSLRISTVISRGLRRAEDVESSLASGNLQTAADSELLTHFRCGLSFTSQMPPREYAYDRASCFSRNTARPGQPHPRPKSPLGISINLATLTTATSKRIKLHPCEQYCSEMHAIGDHYHPKRTAVGSEDSL
jgi:hypothetical protein